MLSRKEELILITIWKLGDDACGIAIRDELEASIGVKWLFGSVYTPLSRLYDEGLISKSEKQLSSERGGRPKVYFKLTPEGKKALVKIKEFSTALWADVPPITI
jgi:PadR family transcriptional regulator PadR